MRTRSALACLTAGVLLAGCSGEPAEPVVAAPGAAVAAVAGPPAAADPAVAPAGKAGKAAQTAASINLTAADVPGLVEQPATPVSPAVDLAMQRAEACTQSPARSLRLVHAKGTVFARPDTSLAVGSEVYVMRDAATAKKELATLGHPNIDVCTGNLLGEQMALESGGAVSVLESSASPLQVSAPRGVAARGLRLRATVVGPGGELQLVVDMVALQHGGTVAGLSMVSTGSLPPAGQRDRLVRLLSQRMVGTPS